jgi:hypothetical protein
MNCTERKLQMLKNDVFPSRFFKAADLNGEPLGSKRRRVECMATRRRAF